MTFDEILDQAIEMLQRRGRVSYRALRRQFDLDEDYLDDLKLEIIKAEYGAGSTFKDVTAVLREHAGDLPLIVLPSGKYNASFGDPLPGGRKQLKIQYRINGKAGRASFAEDALIILPVPK